MRFRLGKVALVHRWCCVGWLAVAAALLTGRRSAAQARLEVTPQLGMYISRGPLFQGFDPVLGDTILRRQIDGALLGTGATLWLNRVVGLEARVAYAASWVATTDSARTVDATAGVILGGVRSLVMLGARPVGWGFYAGPGVGFIHRGAAAQSDVEAALTLTAGARLGLERAPAVHFEVTHYASWLESGTGLAAERRTRAHHDLVWSVGFALPILDRR